MRNIRLTDEDIATERDVILEERNQRTENSPRALFGEQMSAAQYLNHRYGVPIIGWRHEMETLDMEDALSFYQTHYAPNNAILVVTGDVEPDAVKALAEQYYGVIPANPDLPERVRSQEPPQTAERRLTYKDARVSQPYVQRSYLAPERDPGEQEKAAALFLLAELAGWQHHLLPERKTAVRAAERSSMPGPSIAAFRWMTRPSICWWSRHRASRCKRPRMRWIRPSPTSSPKV